MPNVSANTNVFFNLLNTIENKGLKIKTTKAGVNIFQEENLKADIIAPVSSNYSDINNYSAVVKLTYGESTFLFMGDAENESEKEISTDIESDVLKVGHHGSDYSSGQSFLNSVAPSYAVISVGKGNQYGHPCQSTLEKLVSTSTKIFRTDMDGNVVFKSDSNIITPNKDATPAPINPNPPPSQIPPNTTTVTNPIEIITYLRCPIFNWTNSHL